MLDPDAPTSAETSSTSQSPPRRRRSSSRPAGPPKEIPASPAPREVEAVRVPELPAVQSKQAPPSEADSSQAESSTPRRRRPTRTRAAAQDEAAQQGHGEGSQPAGIDAIQASLAELEERPRRSTSRVLDERLANPFAGGSDVSSALDNLAAAIGAAGTAGVATPSDEDVEAEPVAHDESEELDVGETDDDSAEDSGPRRRRRRRGGRRRRRTGSTSEESQPDDSEESEDSEDDQETEESSESEDDTGDTPSEGVSRRRRRRRRRGEDTSGDDDDDSVDVVVKVREPRRGQTPSDEVTSIEGSTRMEAKKQRRREGRAAGRRRAPILSESEFLARREAVDRMMVIRQSEDYSQIGVLEDGILVEHYVDRESASSLIGNVYLGRVQNVLPSMEAAFIDIGRGRNAVLYAGEVDWDSFGVTGDDRRIENVLKSGQAVLVQVTKDPVGAKGARLTSHISLPGRFVVYSPGGQLSGISRKLPDTERQRLKGILDELVGTEASVIVRTAAEGTSEEDLVRDVSRLKAQWEVIDKKVKAGQAPQLLYSEPDLTVRIIRDLFTEDFSNLIVDGNGSPNDAFDTVQAYVEHVAPSLAERLRRWDRQVEGDAFDKFRINEQVAKALERKVHLPSGGSLIIDRTEAMTVIDVNTGKFTGTQGNLEATVTANNLEAAEEIVRQLRLRDIGGIIVIDFIDMVLPANRELLLRRLVECLGRDRTRHQVAEITSLGLVQMTRKKIGTGLHEAFTVPCETCEGRGYHVHDAPVPSQSPADGGDREGNGRRRPTRSRRKPDAPASQNASAGSSQNAE